MRIVKWLLVVFVGFILIAVCAHFLLRPDFSRVDFAGLGGHLTSRLMNPIMKNLDGSPPKEIDPRAPEVYSQAGEIGMIAAERTEPLPMTSEGLPNLEPRKRLDPWGHPFCLTDHHGEIAVISAGANRNNAGCADVLKEIGVARGLRAGILYSSSRDGWVLLVPRKATSTHEN